MRKQLLIAIACMITTAASAQEWKSAVEKWRTCADAAAVRYSKSTESAPVAARLAALSCATEKKQVWQSVSEHDSAHFADDYVETVERHYIDILSVKIIEMRLQR
jgi:hypothetical protein